MKSLTLDEWERKYIVSEVKRFDQRYSMFRRPVWDPKIKDALKEWSFKGELKETPGYTVEEFALRKAYRKVTQMVTLSNTSKPNPSPVAQAVINAIENTAIGGMQVVTQKPDKDVRVEVRNPETMSEKIKKVASYFGADLVGICRLERRWVYSHTLWEKSEAGSMDVAVGESRQQVIPEDFKYVVVMAYAEDYGLMKYYPTWLADATTAWGYSQMAITNAYLGEFIRNLGYRAIECTNNDVALSIPLAMQAGLGDIGRNGLLVTPKYGPRIRISKVITDMPLIPDSPIDFGVTEFCRKCKICAGNCPSQSILEGERTTEPHNESNVGGVRKWPVNAETCRIYWGRSGKPCTNCIACCPYNKPYTWFHRTVRWFTDHARWADPFYVKMDKVCGYGRPKSAEHFWEQWRPIRFKEKK